MNVTNLLDFDRDSLAYLRQWTATSWPGTAAQSYESFLAVGRGLLLIDLANGEPVPNFIGGLRARSEYVPAEQTRQHPVLASLTADNRERLDELLAAYEPEREVVYCFTRRKGGLLFCKASEQSGAPEHMPAEVLKRRGPKPPQIPELRGRVVGQG